MVSSLSRGVSGFHRSVLHALGACMLQSKHAHVICPESRLQWSYAMQHGWAPSVMQHGWALAAMQPQVSSSSNATPVSSSSNATWASSIRNILDLSQVWFWINFWSLWAQKPLTIAKGFFFLTHTFIYVAPRWAVKHILCSSELANVIAA